MTKNILAKTKINAYKNDNKIRINLRVSHTGTPGTKQAWNRPSELAVGCAIVVIFFRVNVITEIRSRTESVCLAFFEQRYLAVWQVGLSRSFARLRNRFDCIETQWNALPIASCFPEGLRSTVLLLQLRVLDLDPGVGARCQRNWLPAFLRFLRCWTSSFFRLWNFCRTLRSVNFRRRRRRGAWRRRRRRTRGDSAFARMSHFWSLHFRPRRQHLLWWRTRLAFLYFLCRFTSSASNLQVLFMLRVLT